MKKAAEKAKKLGAALKKKVAGKDKKDDPIPGVAKPQSPQKATKAEKAAAEHKAVRDGTTEETTGTAGQQALTAETLRKRKPTGAGE